MTFRIGDIVRINQGIGRFQGMEDENIAVVWIARDDYMGKEYPGKFNSNSVTVAVRVPVAEMERA